MERAVADGWPWARIAEALDVSRQAVHKKHAIGLDDHDAPPRRRRTDRLRFAASSKLALQRALRAATRGPGRHIGAEHVLLGVLAAEAGTVPRTLEAGDIDASALAAAAHRELERRHTR